MTWLRNMAAESPLGQKAAMILAWLPLPVVYLFCCGVTQIPVLPEDTSTLLPMHAEVLAVVIVVAGVALFMHWIGIAAAFREEEPTAERIRARYIGGTLFALNAISYAIPAAIFLFWVSTQIFQRWSAGGR